MADNKSPTTGSAAAPVHSQKPGFWTRRKKIVLAAIAVFIVLFLVIFLPILFLVIGPKVAQKNINSSVLNFKDASIVNPRDNAFDLALKMQVTDAGHIDAKISYASPMTVAWVHPKLGVVPMLRMTPPPFKTSGGKASVDTTVSNVEVLDIATLTRFNQFLISGTAFTWQLTAKVTAHAMGRDFKNLNLNKTVTLPGMNTFQGTVIKEYRPTTLPGAPVATLLMNATLINPSPVGLELDTATFNVTTQSGFFLGTAVSDKTFIVGNGQNNGTTKLPLTGTLPFGTFPASVAGNLTQVLLGLQNIDLVVTPISVGGSNPVQWIQNALVGAHLNATLGVKA